MTERHDGPFDKDGLHVLYVNEEGHEVRCACARDRWMMERALDGQRRT